MPDRFATIFTCIDGRIQRPLNEWVRNHLDVEYLNTITELDLLGDGPMPVRDLLADVEIEASSLSQQLSVLRRAGIVTSRRDGSAVIYALAGPDVADLMRAARRFLTEMLTGQAELLETLREDQANADDQSLPVPR